MIDERHMELGNEIAHRWQKDILAEKAGQVKDWRSELTEDERYLVQFACMYSGHFKESLAENAQLSLIDKLAGLLNMATECLGGKACDNYLQ